MRYLPSTVVFAFVVLVPAFEALATPSACTEAALSSEPWFVFSSDLSTDVDDVAALAFLIEAVQRGRGRLAACVTDSPTLYAAPAMRAILDAWGHGGVPVGAYQGTAGERSEGSYAKAVAERFGQKGRTRADFEDDVSVLRRVYAAAPERSVVFIAVGFLTSLEGLMRSPADVVSPLSGAELFEQKTAYVVSVGPNFIGNPDGRFRWNWRHAPEAATYVVKHMTRPFYWLPANEIDQHGFPKEHPRAGWPSATTGPETLGWSAEDNPVQFAFERARQGSPTGMLDDGLRRKAFDPAATRFATDSDTKLIGFYHRNVHLEIDESRYILAVDRSGPFSVLELALTSPNYVVRDYLDEILANLRAPKMRCGNVSR